jgi:glycosyltransferase involved in cell wall biosynthesis
MKIGFDAKRAFHNSTGLGNYARTLVTSLAQFCVRNEYHLFNPKPAKNQYLNFTTKLQLPNFSELQTHKPSGFNRFFHPYWRSYSILRDLKKLGIEVFIGLSNELPMGIERTKIKSIVVIHDLIFERYPDFYPFLDRLSYRKKFKSACQRADIVVAISEQTKADIVAFYGISESRIRVIYQSCNPQFYALLGKDTQQKALEKYQLPNDYILYVGTINERKNLMAVVNALKKIEQNTQIPLVVVGNGKEYLAQVLAYVKENKLENRFIHLPKVDFADLPAIYQSAQLFIYPSFFEGFGIPIIEALHSGTPVITSTGSCFAEAGGPRSYYIDPNDPQAIATAIVAILSDKERQADMIRFGLQYVERFKDFRIAREWEELLMIND